MLAVFGMTAWLLALSLLPQPQLLDRTLTRAELLAHGAATARDLGLSSSGLYGAAYADTALLGLDADYLCDHPGAGAMIKPSPPKARVQRGGCASASGIATMP